MKPVISIIIPIFNCDKYLNRLINSILNQSYQNYELILLNDGSTDNSSSILEKFKDKRIKLINKENTGVSDTRNQGLSLATGDLICFLDSDDYISPNYLETIIEYFTKNPEIELLNFAFYSETENSKLKRISSDKISFKEKYYKNKADLKKDFIALWDNTMLYNIWNKVYLKRIINENKIKFIGHNWGEDVLFNQTYLKFINNFYNSNKAFYHYIREREGALTKNYKENLFSIRKQEYYDFNNYFKEFYDLNDTAYLEFSSRRFIERMLGCIENIYCIKMSFHKRYKEIERIIKDPLTRETLKKVKPKSKKTKIALIPIKIKSTLITMFMGKTFHYIKIKHPSIFNSLKNRR